MTTKLALSLRASPDGLGPVSLMRLTEIKDVDELLKDFNRENIVVEEKLDGWKVQIIKTGGKVCLYSRRGDEKTENFPELVEAFSFLPDGTHVEGELVYWDKNKQDEGKVTSIAGSSPENAIKKAKELPGTFKVHLYDVLWSKGNKVADKGFGERRKALQGLVKESDKVKLTKTYSFGDWQKAMNAAVSTGGEGIVLKLKDKPYEYKGKGETEPKPPKIMYKYKGGVGKSDSDDYVVFDFEISEKDKLKALYGQYYKGKLYHMSEISNFSKEDEEKIKSKLKKGPFVIEIGFQERQPGGLRHQKFVRFREDKSPKDATMHEFHSKNIDKFKVADRKEADDPFGDPEKERHASLIAELKKILEDVGADASKITIGGSGVLGALGMKSIGDLDVHAAPEEFKKIEQHPDAVVDEIRPGNPRASFETKVGEIEIFTGPWEVKGSNFMEEGIPTREHLGFEHWAPEHVLKWKEEMGRPKDQGDIELLREHLSKRASVIKVASYVDTIIQRLEKMLGITHAPGRLGTVGSVDGEKMFRVMAQLESGGRTHVIGDSGTSFGPTQVHGPYFMGMLSRMPNVQSITGISPSEFKKMASDWKKSLRAVRNTDIWNYQDIDPATMKEFVRKNPKSRVRRREGTFIRYRPDMIVLERDGRYVGKTLKPEILKQLGNSPAIRRAVQKVFTTYITENVARSKLAEILTMKSNPGTFVKFRSKFNSRNIRKDKAVGNLIENTSRQDFMNKIRATKRYVEKAGYDTTAPNAYNIYQLIIICNGSGPGRVQRFLYGKKPFGPGHLHYLHSSRFKKVLTKLMQTQPDLAPIASELLRGVPGGKGMGGFPARRVAELSLLSKRAYDEDEFVEEDTMEIVVNPVQREVIGELYSRTENEFRNNPALKEQARQEYSQIYNKDITDEEFGYYLSREIANFVMENWETLKDKFAPGEWSGEERREASLSLSKRAGHAEPGALYFPAQYVDAIKNGKRRMTIRTSDVPISVEEVVKCRTYGGAHVCDLLITAKERMSSKRVEKAFGKRVAKALERRFGPNKRYMVIRFDVYDGAQFADDDNDEDQEKMSEVLIDKEGTKLTRGQIKSHYEKPEIRKKIMSRIKDKPVLIYIGIGKNQKILKRNHDGKEIKITNDDPGNSENPNNYFYWVKRRILSFHQVFGTKTNLGFVDLDIHGKYSLDQAKKYAKALAKKLKAKYGSTPAIFQSGGTGLHVEFKLDKEVGIDKLRAELKALLNELNEDWPDVKTGVVKGDGMRSDISTLHNKGSIRVPGSIGETQGKVKGPLGGKQDDSDQFPQSYGKKYTMLPENLDKEPGGLDTGAIPFFPTKGVDFGEIGSYFDADDKMALSKREITKEAKAKKVLMILSPEGFCEIEYTTPLNLFVEKFKFDVDTASSGLKATGNRGTAVDVSKKVASVDVGDYDALFVVGGMGMVEYSKDKKAQKLLRKFVRQKKPVAMICHAPLLAAEAGVMKGREVTGWPEIMGSVRRSKGIWTGLPIEKDGLLFTAIGPDDSENFAWVFANFLNGAETLGPAKQKYEAWLKASEVMDRIEKFAAGLDEAEVERLKEEQRREREEEGFVEPTIPRALPSEKAVEMFGEKMKPYGGTYEELEEEGTEPKPKRKAPGKEELDEFLKWRKEKEEAGLLKGMKQPYQEFLKEREELATLEEEEEELLPEELPEEEEEELLEEISEEEDEDDEWEDVSEEPIPAPAPEEEIKEKPPVVEEAPEPEPEPKPEPEPDPEKDVAFEEEELEEIDIPEDEEEDEEEEEEFTELEDLTPEEAAYLLGREREAERAKEVVPPSVREITEKQKHALKKMMDTYLSKKADEEIKRVLTLSQEALDEHLNGSLVDVDDIDAADEGAEKEYNRMMSGFELYAAVPGRMASELAELEADPEKYEERWEEIAKLMDEEEEEAKEEEEGDVVEEYSMEALEEEAKRLGEAKPYFAPKLEIPVDEKGTATWKEPDPPPMSSEALDFFTPEKMEEGPKFRKLLNDPKAWEILKKEPHLLQSWILPYIVRSIGRMWFIRNSGRLNKEFGTLPDAPFGMFDDIDTKRARKLRSQELSFEDQPEAKPYIQKVIEKTTDLANEYFSEDRANVEPINMDKWIYKILDRQMVKEVAKDKGYTVSKNPVCSVCKTLERNSLPSKMQKVKKRTWSCPDCIERVEGLRSVELPRLDSRLTTMQEEQSKTNKLLRFFSKAKDTYTDPKEKESAERKIRELNRFLTNLNEKISALAQEKQDIEKKIGVYSAQAAVPWSHTWCPSPTCPGGRVPLNSIDWNHHIWKTGRGQEIKAKLKRYYGLVPPEEEKITEQEAREEGEAAPSPEGEGRTPPAWLDEVPLICPHDGVRFTIGQARKEQKVPAAGFLWGPHTRDIWGTVEKELKREEIPQEHREQNPHAELMVAFNEVAPIGQSCAVRQYYDFYDELSFLPEQIEAGEVAPLSPEKRKAALRKLFLLSAAKDYAFDEPLHYVGWMARAMLEAEVKKNKGTGSSEVQNKLEERKKRINEKFKKQEVSIPLLQRWVDKMLSVEDPYERFGLDKWLVNMKRDGIPSDGPGTYFITRVEDGLKLPRKDAIPLGAKFNLQGKEIRQRRRGTTPRLLRVLDIWNLDETDLEGLETKQIGGLDPVPKWQAEKMLAGKEDDVSGMKEHDYNGISLTTKTNQFAPGKYMLVRALVMPGKYDWTPIKAINELENNKIGADFWDKFHELIVLQKDNPEFWTRFSKQIERTMKEYPYNIEDILDMELFKVKGRKKAQLKLAKDPLSTYKKKREFDETPEPEGKEEGKNKHRFVIQRHKAERAGEHFDLRLENDQGAMSSWSIPKHKLPKGKENLLAMKTEDHPISYMKFKGEIPKGEYGAGKMEIHDSGTYDDISWSGSKIVFKLRGKKEKGAYKIFKTDGNKWMIMEANEDDLEKKGDLLSFFLKEAAKYTKEEYEVLLKSARDRRKMFRIMRREQEKLKELGIDPICVSSTAAGINIPGVSDIDFQVGTDDVEGTSKMLAEAGIPFSGKKEGAYVEHTYETPEGVSVDLKVRPKEHVEYQLKGLKRILDAPVEERHRQILEKHRALQEGDMERYKEVKLDLYKKHRLMPPDADWSKIGEGEDMADDFLFAG